MKVSVLIRNDPPYRREAFCEGLKALGYQITDRREHSDALVIWNRYGYMDALAQAYERRGAPVIVTENGYLGRDWRGGHWYALARSFHNGGGWWPDGGPKRWDAWNVPLGAHRTGGEELVVLATRGIGPQSIREPNGWSIAIADRLRKSQALPVRIRKHPGETAAVPLEQDLARAAAVVTWGSGAALKALLLGIPVLYGFPKWIGAEAGTFLNGKGWSVITPRPRLPAFQRLAWAMFDTDEIATGEPFKCLLT